MNALEPITTEQNQRAKARAVEYLKLDEVLRNLNIISAPEALCDLITPLTTSHLIEALKAEAEGCNPAPLLNQFYDELKADLFAEFEVDDL